MDPAPGEYDILPLCMLRGHRWTVSNDIHRWRVSVGVALFFMILKTKTELGILAWCTLCIGAGVFMLRWL